MRVIQPAGTPGLLPEGFSDLEPFAEMWALRTEAERTARRHSVDIRTIESFYTAMLARLDDALTALNLLSPAQFTEAHKRLHYLTLSLCEVAPAVELYKQPAVVDGFDRARFPRVDIAHMAPPEW